MPRQFQLTISLTISFALHVLLVIGIFVLNRAEHQPPIITPVNIVNLPPQELQKLPPMQRPKQIPPTSPKPIMPEKSFPGKVPTPDKFGEGNDIVVPRTSPQVGQPEGAQKGSDANSGTSSAQPGKHAGPLPFLSQNDIDALARKGLPEKKPGDDTVTLNTDEFKYIAYTRWLDLRLNEKLHVPEIAKVEGLSGVVVLRFSILKDGSLGYIEVVKSSGFKILDDSAINAIRDSAPFQTFPDSWGMDRLALYAIGVFINDRGYIR